MPPIDKVKVTGRKLTFSESVLRLNPHLLGGTVTGVVTPEAVVPVTPTKVPEIIDQKGTTPEDRLNKTEREFLGKLRSGEFGTFDYIGIQALRLSLADRCTYLPDFATHMPMGDFRFWEVKGAHVWEDGWIKLKMAARQFPWWTFVKAQKRNGVWTVTVVNS